MLEMTDNIVRRKVKNSIMLSLYDRFVLPFFHKQIENTPDEDIRQSLQMAYDKLKPHFEKKQMKDMIDEGNKLSGFKIQDYGLLEKEGKYF